MVNTQERNVSALSLYRDCGFVEESSGLTVLRLELDDGAMLTQSLAILEWLDETYPAPPLLPADPLKRARMRAFALAIACETHPLQNLRILNAVRELGGEQAAQDWAKSVNADGLGACEKLIAGEAGPYCFGASPTLADICLIPQLGNARRFGVDVSAYPRLLQAEAACKTLPAFIDAAPEKQPDAE